MTSDKSSESAKPSDAGLGMALKVRVAQLFRVPSAPRIAGLGAALLLVACADAELGQTAGPLEVLDVSNLLEDDSEQSDPARETPDVLYDPSHVPVYKFLVTDRSLGKLAQDPYDYVPAVLEYGEGDDAKRIEVGLRLKGQGSFRTLDRKSAFRVKIDKYYRDQTFHGVRALTLNNMIQDPSLLAERLAYYAFRELGVAAPRANHAEVFVNGELYGIYANIETPNEDFLADWFENADGNLFEHNGYDFDKPDAVTSFDLETNEDQNDRSQLEELAEACRAFDLERAKQLVDWPRFLLYSALEAAANQVDGYSYGQSGPNNYRIYQSDKGFVFIPWGLDWSFSAVATQDGSLFVDPLWVRPSHGVLMRMCRADAECTREYIEVVEQLASRWDDLQLEDRLDEWAAQVDERIERDERREVTLEKALAHREVRREVIRERARTLREAVSRYQPD